MLHTILRLTLARSMPGRRSYKDAAACAIRLARRAATYPLASYQRTARSTAAATEPGRKPNSRWTREQSTNILCRAIFSAEQIALAHFTFFGNEQMSRGAFFYANKI